jgi:hypothetical protein
MVIYKIPIKSTNGADLMFEAISAESLDDFHNPMFCAADIQPIDHMQHTEAERFCVVFDSRDGHMDRTGTGLWGLFGAIPRSGLVCLRNHFVG